PLRQARTRLPRRHRAPRHPDMATPIRRHALAVPGVPTLGLAEVAPLELGYVALPALEQQTITLPLHVNVVPGDQAAGRIPDPVVRTEAAFQRAQQAKRDASSAGSAGDARSAAAALGSARTLLRTAADAAPAPMA